MSSTACRRGRSPIRAARRWRRSPTRRARKDLYFVADGTGGHAFAETLDQHRRNVQRWRQIEKDAKDKLTPDAAPAAPVSPGPPLPKSNQRGDVTGADLIFGSLPLDISGATRAAPVSVTSLPVTRATQGTSVFAQPAAKGSGTGNFDELDVEVAGVKSRSDPAGWDGGDDGGFGSAATQPVGASMQSFPVSAQHLAEQRARAAALGIDPAASTPAAVAVSPSDLAPPTSPGRSLGKGKIIDASEGTSFDPLRDRSYDLSSAKVVPNLKPLPPVKPLASSN